MSILNRLLLEQVLMNGIKDLVFIMRVTENHTFTYDFLNHTAMEKTGLTQSILGKSFNEVCSVEKADVLLEYYRQALENRQGLLYEDSYVSNSGERYNSRTTLTPLFDEKDTCTHILAVVKDITAKKKDEANIKEYLQRLDESEKRYFSLFYYDSDAIFSLDLEGRIKDGNMAVESATGYSLKKLINTEFKSLIVPPVEQAEGDYFQMALQGKIVKYDAAIRNKSDKNVEVSIKFTPIIIDNKVVGVYAVLKDISESAKLLSKLAESEQQFRLITENICDLIAVIDEKGIITYSSPSYKSILEHEPEEYVGKSFFHHNIAPEYKDSLEKKITESLASGRNCKIQFKQHHQSKGWVWFELHGTPVFDDLGQFTHMVLVSRDISLQKKYETRLERFAYHDALTKLPNRRFLTKHLRNALESFKEEEKSLATIMLDLDNFKWINDSLGHSVGDAVIWEFGRRIKNSIRDQDTVARLGGDEFIVLLPEIVSEHELITIIENIQDAMKAPWKINKNILNITSSIGVAIANGPLQTIDESKLLKIADQSLYEAKMLGKNTYKINVV